jgi:hypothetical protein
MTNQAVAFTNFITTSTPGAHLLQKQNETISVFAPHH